MTKHRDKTGLIDVKELLQRDEDFLRAALQALAQASLESPRYLNMQHLAEHKKEGLRQAA